MILFLQKVPCGFSDELENFLTLAHSWYMVLDAFSPMCAIFTFGHEIETCKPKKTPRDLSAKNMQYQITFEGDVVEENGSAIYEL